MRRWTGILLAILVVGATAVGAAAKTSANRGPQAVGKTAKLTIWVGWSARELKEFKGVVAEYDAKHPEVQVTVVGSINDTKITNAIRSGNAPDVVSSFTSANVGVYCGTGAWVDLAPFLNQDHVSLNQFPKTSLHYTQYSGTR